MTMHTKLFCCISTAVACTHAAIVITKPQAGTNVVLNTGSDLIYSYIETAWTDDGNTPAISELSKYTLYLMTGGNLPDNSKQVSINASIDQHLEDSDSSVIGLHSDAAESLEDGFYIKLISLAKPDGNYTGSMTFYSHRFNLIGLTGSTPYDYQAAAAAVGSTHGPATVNNLTTIHGDDPTPISGSSVSATTTPTSSNPSQDPAEANSVLSTPRGRSIGIGLGTTFGAILLCTIIVLACLLRRKRQREATPDLEKTEATIEKAELPGDGKDRPELEHVDRLGGKASSHKDSASNEQIHFTELPTDWTGWEAPALLEIELSRPATMCTSPASDRTEFEVSPL